MIKNSRKREMYIKIYLEFQIYAFERLNEVELAFNFNMEHKF